MEFTKKGHRLERTKDLIFRCVSQTVGIQENELRKMVFVLSEVSVWAVA